jgi:hypothetical protein
MVSGMVAVVSPNGQLALAVVITKGMTRCVRCLGDWCRRQAV